MEIVQTRVKRIIKYLGSKEVSERSIKHLSPWAGPNVGTVLGGKTLPIPFYFYIG